MSANLKKVESGYILGYISSYIRIVKKYFLDDSIDAKDLKDVIKSMIDGIINEYFSEYEEFVRSLLSLHSELHDCIYQEYLNSLIDAAEEIKNQLKNIENNI